MTAKKKARVALSRDAGANTFGNDAGQIVGQRPPAGALTAERLRALIQYRPGSGEFEWLVTRRGVTAGGMAGCINGQGYRVIEIDGRTYRGGRLAFLWMTGQWPDGVVDHIDGDRSNDVWWNLRAVTRGENTRNRRTARSNTGLLGVVQQPRKRSPRWTAQITINGVSRHLGTHSSMIAASQAYWRARAARDRDEL